jgi:hypothetical protein
MDGRNSVSPAWSAAAAAQPLRGPDHRILGAKSENSGPPGFVIQSDGTNRIAEVFSCQPAKPPGKEKDRADSEIHKHANPRVRPTCDAKKNRADHYDRR